jgi:NAD(P)-dependent dehydrogenase (short-subunit alcohol dehydrogenase family)
MPDCCALSSAVARQLIEVVEGSAMRILIAGASGAIGQPLVRRLRASQHEVFALTQSRDSAAASKSDHRPTRPRIASLYLVRAQPGAHHPILYVLYVSDEHRAFA